MRANTCTREAEDNNSARHPAISARTSPEISFFPSILVEVVYHVPWLSVSKVAISLHLQAGAKSISRSIATYPILYNRNVSSLKPLAWMGDSLARVRKAPAGTRSDVGYELDRVQHGKEPSDFKPMPDIGSGVMEIRVHDDNEFRVFYLARFEEAVYVLHCFVKKTRTTAKSDIDLGRKRYAELLEWRRRRT